MKWGIALAALAAAVLTAFGLARASAPESAVASSHREAPVIADDPAADNTDLYAFRSPDRPDTVTLVANYIPLEEPAGGPNFHQFSNDVLYEIKIARGPASLAAVVTYQFLFKSNAAPVVDPADQKAALGGGKEFFFQITGVAQTMDVWKIEKGQATQIIQRQSAAIVQFVPRVQIPWPTDMG